MLNKNYISAVSTTSILSPLSEVLAKCCLQSGTRIHFKYTFFSHAFQFLFPATNISHTATRKIELGYTSSYSPKGINDRLEMYEGTTYTYRHGDARNMVAFLCTLAIIHLNTMSDTHCVRPELNSWTQYWNCEVKWILII